jgi:major type 1 subunit fimbrin (pilin)
MKKLILSAAMIAGLGLLATSQAMAADGTITFTGEISAVTCTVHGGTPGSGSGDFTVPLQAVSASAFNGAGSVAGAEPYSIYVGAPGETGCADGTVVHVHYEPTSPQIAPNGNLNVTGGAGGVQIQLLNADRSVINLRNAPDSTPVTVAGNTAELPFFAQYYSATGSVTPGTANSSVLYSIAYN